MKQCKLDAVANSAQLEATETTAAPGSLSILRSERLEEPTQEAQPYAERLRLREQAITPAIMGRFDHGSYDHWGIND